MEQVFRRLSDLKVIDSSIKTNTLELKINDESQVTTEVQNKVPEEVQTTVPGGVPITRTITKTKTKELGSKSVTVPYKKK